MIDKLIEAVARALYDIRQEDDGRPLWADATEVDRLPWIARTENTFAAIEASGYAVVPVEPTYEMLSDADSAIPRFEPDFESKIRMMGVDGAKLAWAAMLAARPKVTP